MKQSKEDDYISSIISDQSLAIAIHNSVAYALGCPFVHLVGAKTVWDIFKHSLDAAIRDIDEHPRGKLFQRLIEYGPLNHDDPETLISDNETTLSDPECVSCIEFIYSHMVNRFKGEIAEILALDPCIKLIQQLCQNGHLSSDIKLFWGDTIQERKNIRVKVTNEDSGIQWGEFTKGADGLLIEEIHSSESKSRKVIKTLGVIEVKSMTCNTKKVLNQINKHIMRLHGGVRLKKKEWDPINLIFPQLNTTNKKDESIIIRIMVMPSTWKLSREWHSVKTDKVRTMVFSESSKPPVQTQVAELKPNFWKITLEWSQEALEKAAYEMTFWYMSQVGEHIYTKKELPKGW